MRKVSISSPSDKKINLKYFVFDRVKQSSNVPCYKIDHLGYKQVDIPERKTILEASFSASLAIIFFFELKK